MIVQNVLKHLEGCLEASHTTFLADKARGFEGHLPTSPVSFTHYLKLKRQNNSLPRPTLLISHLGRHVETSKKYLQRNKALPNDRPLPFGSPLPPASASDGRPAQHPLDGRWQPGLGRRLLAQPSHHHAKPWHSGQVCNMQPIAKC